ncbi:cysteine-rich receptor-like protein kinase 10 [Sorghum bicolor]|uniref:Cysteine-rich receptor-like protein kinase 10 n=1 Tax=Sorghum bicolor TaxID=4558 RepID=C5YUT7_SORBI|nr:cysteine-rich receptor-like protein kinase 10 [Sorghum bicolor]EES17896.1 hypothetical protein SORBI_3009G082200 [Sorghum bicolor]|eukprot:XP_002439466.1 cysteine-rich receptor-like protein kinase 10 [Sorghum bicolor]
MATTRRTTMLCRLFACAAVLLLVFHHVPLAIGQPFPQQVCNDTSGNYTENSAYQANIRLLQSALPNKASSSPALFATGTAGTGADAAYALALCRGDTNASSCASCVSEAFVYAQQLCALKKGATMYNNPCILRYADWDFLANTTDNRGKLIAWSFDNVSSSAAPAFDAASGRLVNATADYAANNSARRFGTGELPFDQTYPKIYSLAQCTPDMTAADCRTCLGTIIRTFTPTYFTGKHGGRVLGVRCNFRFETYQFFSGRPLLQLLAPPGPPPSPSPQPSVTGQGRRRDRTALILATALPLAAAILIALAVTCFCFRSRRTEARQDSAKPYSTNPDNIQSIDSLLLDLSTLRSATENFAESSKLGEGGFGAVYKGVLPDGLEIAVKRLSLGSRQGVEELKTELVLVAKLQHKNLVRLVGVCLEEQEKILVYEYMPNRSLDTILFDSVKSKELDWGKRLKIVTGVARGLQYLHEESQLKIVHRDLKPSNVLLDSDYNPKISDFGLAKLFEKDQSQGVTSHIAGTYGYMAPEYAMQGQYSVKSDVFSLGVLILEMVTGRKNSSLDNSEESVDLLSLVWEHWSTGTIEELLDPFLMSRQAPPDQMSKLVNIGLLCVQDSPADRPTMSSVSVMLSSNTVSLQVPSRPTFCVQELEGDSHLYTDAYKRALKLQSTDKTKATIMSPNEVSLTELEPR